MFALIAFATLGLVGCEDDYTPSVSLQQTFENQYPNATQVEWEKERRHYVVDFFYENHECEAWYNRAGKWVLTIVDLNISELPTEIKSDFEQRYGLNTPMDDVARIDRNNTISIYVIETEQVVNGILVDIIVEYDANGDFLGNSVETWVDYIYDYL